MRIFYLFSGLTVFSFSSSDQYGINSTNTALTLQQKTASTRTPEQPLRSGMHFALLHDLLLRLFSHIRSTSCPRYHPIRKPLSQTSPYSTHNAPSNEPQEDKCECKHGNVFSKSYTRDRPQSAWCSLSDYTEEELASVWRTSDHMMYTSALLIFIGPYYGGGFHEPREKRKTAGQEANLGAIVGEGKDGLSTSVGTSELQEMELWLTDGNVERDLVQTIKDADPYPRT